MHMISIRKFLNPSLKVATNLFSDIFEPVNKRDGFIKGASPIIPIYFYRYIGIEENQEEYYDELKKLDGELKKIDKLYLQFNERVTLKGNNELTQRMQNMWQNNNFNSLEDVKIEKLIKLLKVYSIIPHVNDELINSTIEESFQFPSSFSVSVSDMHIVSLRFIATHIYKEDNHCVHGIANLIMDNTQSFWRETQSPLFV